MYLFKCEVSVGKSLQRLKLTGLDEALIRIDEALKIMPSVLKLFL